MNGRKQNKKAGCYPGPENFETAPKPDRKENVLSWVMISQKQK